MRPRGGVPWILALAVVAGASPGGAAPAPVDPVHVVWRRAGSLERLVLPGGAQQVLDAGGDSSLASWIVHPDDAPRPWIVEFSAPPGARRGRADLEAARAPHRRFLADLAAAARGAPARVRHRFEIALNGVALVAPGAVAEELRRLDYVASVFPDDSVHLAAGAAASGLGHPGRPALAATGAGVLVSVIDTGVDYQHPALGGCFGPGCRVAGGHDFVNGDADPADDHGHGTHVAGIAGASGGGLSGVAPGIRFLAYKVLSASGSGLQSDVIAAIDRSLDPDGDPVTDDAAQVINLSLGSPGDADGPLARAVDRAVAAGVVCVAAAGNAADYFTVQSPGCARSAITAGAVDAANRIAAFSSRGPSAPDDAVKPDLVAPGAGIVSAWPGGGSVALSGTSMAAPHVAGVAALLLELHPRWSPDSVRAALMGSALDLGVDPFQQGAGRIDALAAASIGAMVTPASLSFGLAPAAARVWSAAETLAVRGAGAAPLEIALTAVSNLPAGSSIRIEPASVTLAAGETRRVVVTLALDHAPDVAAPPHAYWGEVRVAAGGRTGRVPFAVLRSPQLVIGAGDGGLVVVHDRAAVKRALAIPAGERRRLFLPAGTYDVIASLGAASRVVREGIVLADSQGVVLDPAAAVHAIQRDCIDERGQAIDPPVAIEYLRHRGTGFGILTIGGIPATTRFSDVGPDYEWEWHRLSYGQEPVTYEFMGAQRGVSASAAIRNAPSDLRRIALVYHPTPGLTRLLPMRWVSDGPRGSPWHGGAISSVGTSGWLPALEPPFTQVTHVLAAPDSHLHFRSRWYAAYPHAGVPYPTGVADVQSPHVVAAAGQPARGYLAGEAAEPVGVPVLDRLEVGLGPPAWFGSFGNRADRLRLAPRRGSAPWTFLGQYGDAREPASVAYELRRDGTLVASGTMAGTLDLPLVPGRHDLTALHDRYWIGERRCRAAVVASFDTRAADPDPPFLAALSVLADGVPAALVPAGARGTLRLDLGDAALDSVSLETRGAGEESWSPLAVTRDGGRIEAALPGRPGGERSLRIVATDAAGNRLTVTLEPAVVVEAGPDLTPPSVTLVAPAGGERWESGSARTLAWSAADDAGVAAVDLALSRDGGATFAETIAAGIADAGTRAWVVPGGATRRARVRITVRDAAGNAASDTSADFEIADASNLAADPGFESGIAGWSAYGSASLTHALEGRGGGRALQIRGSSRSSFGCDDLPNWVGAVAARGAVYRFSAWVRTPNRSRGKIRLRVYEFLGSSQQGSTTSTSSITLPAAWTLLTLDYAVRTAGSTLSVRLVDEPAASGEVFLVDDVDIRLLSAPADAAPVVTAPEAVSAAAGIPLAFTVQAADPDGPAIAALTADGKPAGAAFVANAARTSGTFTWTPAVSDVRAEPYAVVFTAANTRTGADTTRILVGAAPANLCGNGDFESGLQGWGAYGNGVLAVADGGRTGRALQVSGSSSFGIDDVPDWLPGPLARGAVIRIACWVRRAGGGGSAGTAKIRVYEYLGSSQQGSTAYSPTVTLDPAWQQLVVTYTVRVAGTRLSIRVTDAASSSGETFLVDDVTIEAVGAAAAASAAGDPALRETVARFAAAFVPNPATSGGVLTFTTTRPGPARIDLLDVHGRRVRRLIDERRLEPGEHDLSIDRSSGRRGRLPPGVYFYWIEAGEGTIRGRIVFLE